MTDPLDLLKKGARVQQQEEFRDCCRKIERLVQNIQINLFRIHDEDLSFKADLVLQAAQELLKTQAEALRLQKELGD